MIEELLRQRLAMLTNILLEQIRPQQSHAAVDVEAHAARRDDGLGIVAVEGRDAADRKAVSRV